MILGDGVQFSCCVTGDLTSESATRDQKSLCKKANVIRLVNYFLLSWSFCCETLFSIEMFLALINK